MQRIIYNKGHINPLFEDFNVIYQELSAGSSSLVAPVVDISFRPLIELFKEKGFDCNIEFADKSFKPVQIDYLSPKKIVLCFSGGKDSVAVVKKLLKADYSISLYHVKNINPPLSDEYKVAGQLAHWFNLPIYVDSIKLSGYHQFIEHPMKNMMIVNGALQYGISECHTVNVAFGNYLNSSLQQDNFEFCGGDTQEMWDIYNSIISHIIPDFKVINLLQSLNETLETICPDRELLDMTVSCLCRASLRPHWHEWAENKFNIKLPKYRCGRCYKCCVEYIYMADHNLTEYKEDYYEYCLNNLRKNLEKEKGHKCTSTEVWNNYFEYEGRR